MKKQLLIDIEDNLKEIEAQDMTNDSNEEEMDVPNVTDDKEYTTFFRLGEQEEEEEPPMEEEEQEEVPEEEMDSNMAGEEGMDPNAEMGMGNDQFNIEEPPKDPNEIGRIYELKKIYSRLLSIESYLSNSSDIILIKLRNKVSKSIELFEILSSNFKSYVERLDEIIIQYYKFLDVVYALLNQYYEEKQKEEKKK